MTEPTPQTPPPPRKPKFQPKRYSDDRIEEALRAAGGIILGAAQLLGCDEGTIRKRLPKSKRLQRIKAEVEESLVDIAESQLIKQVRDGNMTAIIFYLKTKGKARGYVERTELAGEVGISHEEALRQLK